MATANPTQSKAITKQSAAARKGAQSSVQVAAPSRREFLYYIWGASIALLLGQVSAGLVWFTFPRFREGEFGGIFPFNPGDLPTAGSAPLSVPAGRFHVSNTDNGLLVLYGVCTHLGCLPKWNPTTTRFECPCHGSKFQGDGSYIEGPAPRSLDQFPVEVVYANGSVAATPEDGSPIPLAEGLAIDTIRINTGSRITGRSNV